MWFLTEMIRRDAMLQTIQNPSTHEGAVAARAQQRISQICKELRLNDHVALVRTDRDHDAGDHQQLMNAPR